MERVRENFSEAGNLIFPVILTRVFRVEKKLATEHLQNALSYTLHRNNRVRANHYRNTKLFFPLYILQADLLTLDEIQRRHNPYEYILLVISMFSSYEYGVPFLLKRTDKVDRALGYIF